MYRVICTAILFFLGRSAIAQKGIDNLIKAEKDFAAYSVAHSTKEAFLQFIDSNSIMFDKGVPVKAIEFWNKREKRPGVLNWHPQFAEISASEDFGWTSGPWTFQNSINDSVIARGQYSTVWALDKNGQWKFLVDLGIDNTQQAGNDEYIVDIDKKQGSWGDHSAEYFLERADLNFNQLSAKETSKAYKTYLSDNSILTRNGSLPATTAVDRKLIIDATPAGIQYTTKGWGVSPVPDMAYSYGIAIVNGKTENYLRIWRREKDGWKIALEVLRY